MDKKLIASLGLIVVGISLIWFEVGFVFGMNKAVAIQDEVNCKMDWGYKPVTELPAKCAKYFDLKK